MTHRATTYELVRQVARCQRCTWSCTSKNAQALAAKHFDQKGHVVFFEKTDRITYGPGSRTAAKDRQQERLI